MFRIKIEISKKLRIFTIKFWLSGESVGGQAYSASEKTATAVSADVLV